jgi:Cu-Zn family superoxide dismutase
MQHHQWRTLPSLAAMLAVSSTLAGCGVFGGGGSQGPSPRGSTASVELQTSSGQSAGRATLTSTGDGVFISAQLRNLPEGMHAIHLHSVGRCDTPDFNSAGGHVNSTDRVHGFLNEAGEHDGDLPNISVRSDGTAVADLFTTKVVLAGGANALLDDDGSSLVIHSGTDDYRSDPAGNSGPRIACGVIRK